MRSFTCPRCGYLAPLEKHTAAVCPLCTGQWEQWELQFSPLPLPKIKAQVAAWLGHLPPPAALELRAEGAGLSVRLYTPPGKGAGAIRAWAALTQQQSRWQSRAPLENHRRAPQETGSFALHTRALLPSLTASAGDSCLAIGGQLLSQARQEVEAGHADPTLALRIWILGPETHLQDRLRALAAYQYGTEGGVQTETPNPWGLRLALWRAGMGLGGLLMAACGGLLATRWVAPGVGSLGLLAGGLIFWAALLGTLGWLKWRSLPADTLARSIQGPLLRVALVLQWSGHPAPPRPVLELLAGQATWRPLPPLAAGKPPCPVGLDEWPGLDAWALPLPAAELAGLIAPPEASEGSGLLNQALHQDVPAPAPAPALVQAPFKIGTAVATAENIGIDPDGHGLATGGSRTGKSSFVFRLLKQLSARGAQAPGILLIDPHTSLADGFLDTLAQLPEDLRAQAIQRLRVITPDQPEVVPLNLLALPEFSWAGNAIIQAGERIWGAYWGPRMQAALLGLFRLAHAWNRTHPERCLGLLHVVFAAFNRNWRHSTMAYLDPVDRLGSLALDALLGQLAPESGPWNQKWATEVVSPVLSKAMALELSPWLFAAMHQARFVDLEKWVQERCWIVLRLSSGAMGRAGARLTAGIFYNVFEAAFRKATLAAPVPFYFMIDEAQEIAGGMRLEAMLAEGAKFGARMFVLAQSLAMLRRVEGFDQVVQALLANTSTQAFFSPDPEDADLIRATLSTNLRYGETTLDLPSLQAWLRARLQGRWQPPTQVRIVPLPRADPARVQTLIREVIAAHPTDYAAGTGWQEQVVQAMTDIVPRSARGLLHQLLRPQPEFENLAGVAAEPEGDDQRQLGW